MGLKARIYIYIILIMNTTRLSYEYEERTDEG